MTTRTPKIQEEVEEEAPSDPFFLKRQRCRIRIDFSTHKLLLIGSKLIFSAPTSRPSRVHTGHKRVVTRCLPTPPRHMSHHHRAQCTKPYNFSVQIPLPMLPLLLVPTNTSSRRASATAARRCRARCMARKLPQAPASARPAFRRNCSLAPLLHQQPALGVLPREVSIRARIKRSCA